MGPVTYRLMTEADLSAALYIRKAALDALERSEGREPRARLPGAQLAQLHLLRTDAEGSWIAEIDGVTVGYAQAFVRGDIWFLAQLFVDPDAQAHGVGQGLLERAQDYGHTRGARVVSVVSSTSRAAQALYMRRGMFGIGIGYRVTGPVEPLQRLPEPAGNQKRIADCSGWQDRIAELDREVWGAERRQEHAWLLAGGFAEAETSFALNRDGALLGYGHASSDGWIGMIAAYEPDSQLPLLRMAADWLAEREVETAHAYCISTNQTVLRALLESGWKIDGWTFLLASQPFGKLDRYVPSGGMLL